jgi:hypothetical protein
VSGLYDIVLGDGNQKVRGRVLLGVLGLDLGIPRFRDAWVERSPDGPLIVFYTRTGGDNRTCYCKEHGREHPHPECYLAGNEAMAAHPLYLRDADDSFDPTYASWFFRAPPGREDELAVFAQDPVDMAQRWRDACARIERGEWRPAETAFADQLGARLRDAGVIPPAPEDGR